MDMKLEVVTPPGVSFASFRDPDGTESMLQPLTTRLPGR
jgi:hypothetical protein